MTIEQLPAHTQMPAGMKQRLQSLWQGAGHPTPEEIVKDWEDMAGVLEVKGLLAGTSMGSRDTFARLVEQLDGDVEEWVGMWDVAAFRIMRKHKPAKRAKKRERKAPTARADRLRNGGILVSVDDRHRVRIPRSVTGTTYALEIDVEGVITLRPSQSVADLPAGEVMGVPEAAEALGMTRAAIYQARDAGQLPGQRTASGLKFRRSDVEAYREHLEAN